MQHPQDPLMQRQHPLALPEILINLRGFLSAHTITVCLRVCRDWHRTFLPSLWRYIFVNRVHGSCLGPEELKNHSDLVERMVVYGREFGDRVGPIQPSIAFLDGLYCRNLTRLELDHQDITLDLATKLIHKHHSTLKYISYSCFEFDLVFTDEFLDTLDSCSQLETLKLPFGINTSLKWDKNRLLSDLWSRLRSLSAPMMFPNNDEELRDTTQALRKWSEEGQSVQSKLEDLTLFSPHPSTYSTMVALILANPGLKRLHWRAGSGLVFMEWPTVFLANAVRSGQWRPNYLESLDLLRNEFSLRDFKTVLGATPELKELIVGDSDFNDDYWKVLRLEYPRYLTQLTELNIQDCWDVSGDVVQQILCEMPNLEHFGAPIISASDLLADKRPWICSRLKSLMVFFFLDDETGVEEGSHIVLTQLAKMERLYRLELLMGSAQGFRNFNSRRVVEKRENLLDLTLDRGLRCLSSVGRLRHITGTRDIRSTPWAFAEAEWALANWGYLMSITGVSLSKEASDLLSNAGVMVLGL